MADPRFFQHANPFTLAQICEIADLDLIQSDLASQKITDVATLNDARKGHITFLDNVKYKSDLGTSRASACIMHPKMQDEAPEGIAILLSKTPYKAYALIAQAFYPMPLPKGRVSDHAHIESSAAVDESASVEAGAFIEEGAKISEGCYIGANAVIGRNVILGKNTKVGANATISHAMIGQNVNIYPGVCIGQDGFGFAIDLGGHVKVPQLGRVIIEDNVEVGANTTIDRGAGPDTVIGAGTWIDNQVQIAHNVKVGKGCVIIAQAGIAGSTELEDFVVVAAKAGVAGHLKIRQGARVGAMSGVMKNVGPGEDVLGIPAMPAKAFMKQVATLRKFMKTQK